MPSRKSADFTTDISVVHNWQGDHCSEKTYLEAGLSLKGLLRSLRHAQTSSGQLFGAEVRKKRVSRYVQDEVFSRDSQKDMRIVSLIDGRAVIERILRHLGLWEQGVRVSPTRAPPEIGDHVIELWLDDPFPDYDTEHVRNYPNG